jgi:nitrate/TMAO reductase-like tetraheme cytochrome c subunit
MPFRDRILPWLHPATYLTSNVVTLAGAVLTTSSALTMLIVWLLESVGQTVHPYTGIIIFMVLPGVFVLGLILMPIGVLWERHRLRRTGETPRRVHLDLHDPTVLRALSLVGALTVANVFLLGTASYKGVEYMDSNGFCGTTCHEVMEPEYTAFLESPHSRVGCVQCHIGPGAGWFVRSKLSGVRQVFAVAFNTHSRPIPSPVHQLRPARETCEQCHWPQKFQGDRLVVIDKFAEDEANTRSNTVLMLKIGGRSGRLASGIHGHHLNGESRISYVATDDKRQIIPRVTWTDDSGKTVVFTSEDAKPTEADLARGEHRTMDCMDCHNRPSHTFELPERALDEAMAAGRVSARLPYIKKEALALVKADYPDRERASATIEQKLTEYYRSQYPDVYRAHRTELQVTIEGVQRVYLRNVFPSMNVRWGTYPNNIGHQDFPGCFRCHDGSHKSADGRVITQECDACHNLLAMEEENPKILTDLGYTTP